MNEHVQSICESSLRYRQGRISWPSTEPVNCSNNGAIHIYTPYVPYTYCYTGFGSRNINLSQVETVQARNWNVTVLWKSTNGNTYRTGPIAGGSLHVGGGKVYTIAVP